MALIVGYSIRQLEFGETIPDQDKSVLLRAARVDLTTPIKGEDLPKGTRLLKAYATSPAGAKRIVFMLVVEEGDLFLLFYRNKNDPVGENITIKNKAFKTQLSKHLDVLLTDIENGRFETLEI
ncbi:hypothetical protein [Cerasicoccus maritimus]|uniref:hypothetical protein n=1 Tax=Cerasicoccus maritimus TaxID=490089 RepID=UPI002852CC69|nr:hypothetical protein [Cerasicoccus maritimus]